MPRKSRATRRTSGFRFAIADRIDFLNSADWDSVVSRESIFLSRRYLQAAQDEFTDQIVRDFAIIYESETPVAAIATQSFDVRGSHLANSRGKAKSDLPSEIKKKSLSLIKRRVLMCGNVHTWGPHGVALAAGHDASRLWEGVADCLYRIRRANRLHGQTDYVIVKDLFSEQHATASSLEPFRYRSIETEPNMALSIDPAWESITDYLASLTKKYRAAARKVLKPFDDETFVVGPIENLSQEAGRLHELYKAVAARADVCLFSLGETTLPRLADALGDDFATIGIRDQGRLVGYVTVIRDGDTAVGYYLGIDYEANSKLPIYHRLLLAVIETAIQWRCKQISFGRTALDAKSRLGCVPEDTHVWVRHRVPLLNAVVQGVLKNVSHDEPPERNPFKEVQS